MPRGVTPGPMASGSAAYGGGPGAVRPVPGPLPAQLAVRLFQSTPASKAAAAR